MHDWFKGFKRNVVEESEVINGISFSEDIEFKYIPATSPAYTILTRLQKGKMVGMYKIEESLKEFDIGFLRETIEENNSKKIESQFYQYTNLDEIILGQNKDCINLQLKKTEFFANGKRPVLGINGKEGIYPLIHVIETENETICQGLCLEGGKLNCYQVDPKADTGNNLSRRLRQINSSQVRTCDSKIVNLEGINWNKPTSIYNFLSKYVIEQENAMDMLAEELSIYMMKASTKDEEIVKDNILMLGQSGCGKTHSARTIIKQTGLPYILTSMADKTAEGYKGVNFLRIFEDIRRQTSEEAPHAIIFIDEIDKLVYAKSDEMVRRFLTQFLTWSEQDTIYFEEQERTKTKYLGGKNKEKLPYLKTDNILFIAAGSFSKKYAGKSLKEIITERIHGKKQIGFGRTIEHKIQKNIMNQIKDKDLIEFGLSPEFVGRFSTTIPFQDTTINGLVKILEKPGRSLTKSWKKVLKIRGYDLTFEKEALQVIAQNCPEETGARALKSVTKKIMSDVLKQPEQHSTQGKIIITESLAEELLGKKR